MEKEIDKIKEALIVLAQCHDCIERKIHPNADWLKITPREDLIREILNTPNDTSII